MRSRVRANGYSLSTWAFLRLLGVIYFVAFWSLHGQILGLIGSDGILPVAEYLTELGAWADDSGLGAERYREVPTLFWLSSSDAALRTVTGMGVGLAILLTAGIAPAIALPLLWLLYLSVTVAGRDFLSFQWDGLLLETGLLAMLVSPMRWWHRPGDAFADSSTGTLLRRHCPL